MNGNILLCLFLLVVLINKSRCLFIIHAILDIDEEEMGFGIEKEEVLEKPEKCEKKKKKLQKVQKKYRKKLRKCSWIRDEAKYWTGIEGKWI